MCVCVCVCVCVCCILCVCVCVCVLFDVCTYVCVCGLFRLLACVASHCALRMKGASALYIVVDSTLAHTKGQVGLGRHKIPIDPSDNDAQRNSMQASGGGSGWLTLPRPSFLSILFIMMTIGIAQRLTQALYPPPPPHQHDDHHDDGGGQKTGARGPALRPRLSAAVRRARARAAPGRVRLRRQARLYHGTCVSTRDTACVECVYTPP